VVPTAAVCILEVMGVMLVRVEPGTLFNLRSDTLDASRCPSLKQLSKFLGT
jgi:hypothetical protein